MKIDNVFLKLCFMCVFFLKFMSVWTYIIIILILIYSDIVPAVKTEKPPPTPQTEIQVEMFINEMMEDEMQVNSLFLVLIILLYT